MTRGTGAHMPVGRIAACSAIPVVIPLVVYTRLFGMLGVLPTHARDVLRASTIRLGISVTAVALILSLLTCVFLAVRLGRSVHVVQAAGADVALVVAFLLAPWIALRVAGDSPSEVISLWVGPGALVRAIPAVCAAIAGVLFVATTRRARRVELAA